MVDTASSVPVPATVADGYAALDHAHQHLIAAETAEVIAIAHLTGTYRIDQEAVQLGMENLIEPGADGTPGIGEFLALEVRALLGVSPASAMSRIGDVLNVRHRHPALWEAVLTGRVRYQRWRSGPVVEITAKGSPMASARIHRSHRTGDEEERRTDGGRGRERPVIHHLPRPGAPDAAGFATPFNRGVDSHD